MKWFHPASHTIAMLAFRAVSATANASPGQLRDVKSGSCQPDPAHMQIVFSLSHLGFTEYTGIFSGVAGTLKLEATKLEASRVDPPH
jgi:polyisoprenoid-binding protein YceI